MCCICVGDHLVQAAWPFVSPFFGNVDNDKNKCVGAISIRTKCSSIKGPVSFVESFVLILATLLVVCLA